MLLAARMALLFVAIYLASVALFRCAWAKAFWRRHRPNAFLMLFSAVGSGVLVARLSVMLPSVLYFSPVIGLLCLVLFDRWKASQESFAFLSSALSFLTAVHGFVKAGISFPTAFFELSARLDSPFSWQVRHSLGRYQEGRGFVNCLQALSRRHPVPALALFLAALETAYCQGLSTETLLRYYLPRLREEHLLQKRMNQLRAVILFQVGVSVTVPLMLLYLLDISFTDPFLFVFGAAMMAAGAVLSWRVASF